MKTLPSTDQVTRFYDRVGRLIAVDYDGTVTPDVGFGYDANGNRTVMVDGAGTVTYEYDALNRLTEVTRDSDTISYAYDDAGNITSRTYPGSLTTSYAYDDADRLETVTAGSRTTTYVYDEAGNVIEIDYPSSTSYVSTRTYDEAGRLTEIVNEDPGTAVASEFSYTLDPVGNPTQVVTGTETITYDYDELDRLTEVRYVSGCSGSGLAGITYTYDDVGNRVTQVRHSTSNTTTNYTYNDDDQLTQVGSQTWAYDDNGNLITRGNRTLTYDLENRLLTSVLNGTHTYAYDGDGNRLTDATGTAANDFHYVWDPNFSLPQVAIERDGNDAFLRNYVYGVGRLAQSTNSTNAFYYLTDSLGSTANLVKHDGGIKWTYTYEPFGTERSATSGSGAPNNFMRFTGERIDSNGDFYNLRARMYDPSVGRFFQEDPILAPPQLPLDSSYAYVRGRPTIAADNPSGLWCLIPSLAPNSSGCFGGGLVSGIGDWVADHPWEIATVVAAAGCAVPVVGLAGCAAILATYVGTQTAVLYEDYDEELSVGLLINALCGIGKSALTLGRNAIAVLQAVTDTIASPIGPWFSFPGCWAHSPK